mmetsp:Transcript_23530/g.49304  ORF Transcript_23530/g.49304 Transcript_23530/m.49304 type:complete len:148 (+) Transcript_23530:121-564(+)
MNDHQETTAKTEEPKLCKMGCGFFGSNATGDCCSRCFNQMKMKEGVTTAAPTPAVAQRPQPPATPASAPVTSTPTPAPVAEPASVVADESKPAAPSPTKKKKKKKKASYKNMIAGMMKETGPRDAEKEKESIQKVTGGGAFVKIDKI